MASNPMQRKARNSFLLGVIITLLLAAIIGALLYVLVIKDKLETTGGTGVVAYVYKLKTGVNVESGKTITLDMVEEVKLNADIVPEDAIMSKIKPEKGDLQDIPFPAGYKSKIALRGGTILGSSMLYADDLNDNSLRLVEFNMITLPTTVNVGEYVDVRITLPTGQDLVVLSKKCIESIKQETIGMYLTESEIITMSSAIVDAYTTKASNIYLTKYVEAGMQDKAEQTYVVKQAILEEMTKNPNIVVEAKRALAERWNDNGVQTRANIEGALSGFLDPTDPDTQRIENIEEKMKEQIEKSKEQYLQGLQGY